MKLSQFFSTWDSGATKNAVSLAFVQLINFLTPLATLPYVLRTLGPNEYGKVIFYQAVAQYFSIFVDFGFQLSATKAIATAQGDSRSLAQYAITVQTCRSLLALLSVLVWIGIFLIFPEARQDSAIFLSCLLAVIGTLLTPMWLFAGLGRVGTAAMVVAVTKICAIPLTFLFVNHENDAWRFALANSISVVAGGVSCCLLITRWKLINFWAPPTGRDIRTTFEDGWHYFITVAAAAFYSTTNPILLGLVTSSTQVAYFGAADRIRTIALAPLQPISNAYFPVLSRLFASDDRAASSLLRRLFVLLVGGSAIIALVLFLGAPSIVYFVMGKKYSSAIPVLQIMALVPILIATNTALGPLAILAMGLKRQGSRIILFCGAGNLVLLAFFGKNYGALGAAASLFITEAMVAICLAITLRRNLARRAKATSA